MFAPPPPPPPGQSGGGLAIAALVLGIVACVFGLIPLFAVIALSAGIVGLILGILARRQPVRRTMATWAIVLGGVGIGLGVLGLVILDEAVDDLDDAADRLGEFGDDDVEAHRDVEITDCSTDEFGGMTARLRVSNPTAQAQDYTIDVLFQDGNGDRIDRGTTFVDRLESGQTANDQVTGFSPGGDRILRATCELDSVDRNPSL